VPPNRTHVAELERVYRKHGSALLVFATAISGERSRAQDAVHQVFLRLIEEGGLRQAVDVKAYLFACVRNAVLNDLKARQRNVALDYACAWFDPPDKDYAAERNLRCAMAALPDDQQQVIVLRVWGELTFPQIGELLNISSNTAASRYRYALAKLRESMCAKEDFCANS
jgi:RNA polymerase sigma-70 factor, ECF subfamily